MSLLVSGYQDSVKLIVTDRNVIILSIELFKQVSTFSVPFWGISVLWVKKKRISFGSLAKFSKFNQIFCFISIDGDMLDMSIANMHTFLLIAIIISDISVVYVKGVCQSDVT